MRGRSGGKEVGGVRGVRMRKDSSCGAVQEEVVRSGNLIEDSTEYADR